MSIPGVGAAVGLVMRGVGASLQLGMQLLSLPTRVIGIVGRTEVLLTRIEMLVGTVERAVGDLEADNARAQQLAEPKKVAAKKAPEPDPVLF